MTASVTPLRDVIRQLLLGRTEELDARGVAAFVSGWCAALDVVGRIDVALPEASADVRVALELLLDRVQQAGRDALADPD
jgi:hypothetical protein